VFDQQNKANQNRRLNQHQQGKFDKGAADRIQLYKHPFHIGFLTSKDAPNRNVLQRKNEILLDGGFTG